MGLPCLMNRERFLIFGNKIFLYNENMPPGIGLVLIWLVAFLSGAIPFSVWLGRLFIKKDVRNYGDGNPGAMNVFRSGNLILGLVVLILDVSKGVLPVIWAKQSLSYTGWMLMPVAVLPVLGHAFSPFLKFKGGKALAVTLGTWIGLPVWKIPLVAVVVIVAARFMIKPDVWMVSAALLAMGLALLFWMPDGWLVLILLLQTAIILWKYRDELLQRPRWRWTKRAGNQR